MNKIRWPEATLERISHEQGLAKENLDEWLGIELIAERTRVIGNFIYFPFIAMFLIGIARYPYLDNWDFPAALILIFVLSALLLVGNTLALRRSAETARRQAIKRLGKRAYPAIEPGSGRSKAEAADRVGDRRDQAKSEGRISPIHRAPHFWRGDRLAVRGLWPRTLAGVPRDRILNGNSSGGAYVILQVVFVCQDYGFVVAWHGVASARMTCEWLL